MADNDDYMSPKAYDDTISETMWDRLQEGINANRRFRLKGIVGGNNMRYSSTKVVWDTDIYIYFTRESDGAWVYNKINANPTTGVACGNDDVLYVVLNDTTATVLTVTVADYTSMPTDDTGRILILGAVRDSRWYGISSTDISHDSILGVSIDDHHAQSHNNTYHTTNYEVANANIQTHVGSPPADSHHTRYADSEVESVITAELVNGQSIDLAIDSLILTHKNIATAHHTKTTSFGDLTDDIAYTQVDAIVDTSGAGASNLISRADHVHTAGDGSSKITYSNLLSIPSTFAPSVHNNTAHNPDYATSSALTSHTGAANPHSGSAPTSHTMASHSDETTYSISTSGTYAFGAAAEDLDLGAFDLTNVTQIRTQAASDYNKLMVYNDAGVYGIGMVSAITYGYLNDWAMTFRMSATSIRGFWWGHSTHTKAQGAMSLSVDGELWVDSIVVVPITSTDSIQAKSKWQHKINMYPVADEIHIYPGDVVNNPHIIFNSIATTSSNPKIYPPIHETGYVGNNSTPAWRKVAAKYVYDDDGVLGSYDSVDDLAIIDNMTVWEKDGVIQRDEDNIPLIDYNTIPDFLKGRIHEDPDDETSPVIRRKYIRPSLMATFSWGAIKQLHQKVKDQEILISQLNDRILILESGS